MLVTVLWVLLALVLLVGSLALLRANRLDRLHARAEGAASALRSALDRRCDVAAALAGALPAEQGRSLQDCARRARRAAADERESAENELTAQLAGLDPDTLPAEAAAELAEVQERVVIARRVHNDAVRDALALRGTRLARWLALVGAAPAPRYFEITEPDRSQKPPAEPVRRRAARVVLLDDTDRVLLFEGIDPARPQERFWFTIGGGIDASEQPEEAAIRELAEETGLRLSADQLTGPVWQRDVLFSFEGQPYRSIELFFVARASGLQVDTSGFSDLEQRTVLGHRWWSADELRETTAVIYPAQLAELLPSVTNGWNGQTVPMR